MSESCSTHCPELPPKHVRGTETTSSARLHVVTRSAPNQSLRLCSKVDDADMRQAVSASSFTAGGSTRLARTPPTVRPAPTIDPPKTRTWNLRHQGPTPYPLGRQACSGNRDPAQNIPRRRRSDTTSAFGLNRGPPLKQQECKTCVVQRKTAKSKQRQECTTCSPAHAGHA